MDATCQKEKLTFPKASKTESKYSRTPKSRKNKPNPISPTPISAKVKGGGEFKDNPITALLYKNLLP